MSWLRLKPGPLHTKKFWRRACVRVRGDLSVQVCVNFDHHTLIVPFYTSRHPLRQWLLARWRVQSAAHSGNLVKSAVALLVMFGSKTVENIDHVEGLNACKCKFKVNQWHVYRIQFLIVFLLFVCFINEHLQPRRRPFIYLFACLFVCLLACFLACLLACLLIDWFI